MAAEKDLLSDGELKLVDIILVMFKSLHTGTENAVKTDVIIRQLATAGHPASGQTIRAVIGHIRRNDLAAPDYILSDISNGYWLSSCEKEMSTFLDKQLNRMTNQYLNVRLLIERNRYGKNKLQSAQIQLF